MTCFKKVAPVGRPPAKTPKETAFGSKNFEPPRSFPQQGPVVSDAKEVVEDLGLWEVRLWVRLASWAVKTDYQMCLFGDGGHPAVLFLKGFVGCSLWGRT